MTTPHSYEEAIDNAPEARGLHPEPETLSDEETGSCGVCGGSGEVRHPMWGARNCPEPSIPCKACGGTGEYTAALRSTAPWWQKSE